MLNPVVVIVGYLLGGIPFGLIIVRLMTGEDVRQSGSGNIGATNVLRTTGRLPGVITLLLDALKGVLAVWIADRFTGGDVMWMNLAGMAALFGHAFSPYLRFTGGKAVATFIGVFAYLAPLPLLAVTLLFLLMLVLTRYLSLGSIVSAGLFPLACWMILHPDWPLLVASVASAVLVIWRHKDNIGRIRAGNERLFRFAKTS